MTKLTFTLRRKPITPFNMRELRITHMYLVDGVVAGYTPDKVRSHLKDRLVAEGYGEEYLPSLPTVKDACFDSYYCNPELILDHGRWKIGIHA